MYRLRKLTEKTWTSNNKNYEVIVWMEKGKVNGELYDKSQGKRYTLNEAIAMDRDFPYFPSEVSENLYRLIEELTKNK